MTLRNDIQSFNNILSILGSVVLHEVVPKITIYAKATAKHHGVQRAPSDLNLVHLNFSREIAHARANSVCPIRGFGMTESGRIFLKSGKFEGAESSR
jgi:hypothetical protein